MVEIYKRESKIGDWSWKSIKNAVLSVIQGKMGYYLPAKIFGVPQTNLERKVKVVRKSSNENASAGIKMMVKLCIKSQVVSYDEQKGLFDYILDMEYMLYWLTTKDLRCLVYRPIIKNNKSNQFKNLNEEAAMVLTEAPINVHKATYYHLCRECWWIQQVVDRFFNSLGNGIFMVPMANSKIIAKRGRKQVGAITPAGGSTTVTVEICISASGQYLPPMMVFPRTGLMCNYC